jgi:hypothetical protein
MSDDFSGEAIEMVDELRYPGAGGIPVRRQNLPSSAPGWSRLARNTPLGQKANIFYDAAVDVAQVTPAQILQLPGDEGSDLDATQIQLVLAPPLAIPRDTRFLDGVNIQTATGEMDNAAMAQFGDYPGTTPGLPIAWPPLIYVVEWGVGGTKVKAEIDAVNGAAVNLTASFVRVYGAVPADAENAPGTTGIYTLAAFVGPGWPKPGSAQRTIFVGAIDAGDESDVYATPAFAREVTVMGGLPGNVISGYITFYQDVSGLLPIATYFVNGNQPGSFRVPNAGAYFAVTSGLSVEAPFVACFGLSI